LAAVGVSFAGAVGVGIIGCRNPPPPPPDEPPTAFKNVTAGSGLDFTYRNGQEAKQWSIMESLGGGVALIDYDGDGLLDVFVTGGGYFDVPNAAEGEDKGKPKPTIKGYPCKLFKNLGGFKFKDVTKEVGLDKLAGGKPWFYTHGAAVADYDNDGHPDLLVTGWGRLALFHNVPDPKAPGGRRFVEVTQEAGLTDDSWSTSAAWADLDGDGYPDLYVCHYVDWNIDGKWDRKTHHPDCTYSGKTDVCFPAKFDALPHILYRNNRNGTFTDVSKDAGIRVPREAKDYDKLKGFLSAHELEELKEAQEEKNWGKGLGVIVVDVENTALASKPGKPVPTRPAIYVACDESDKLLYLNRGGTHFCERGRDLGVARDGSNVQNGSMGVATADYNGTGLFSLFVTNFQNEIHGLYRNDGSGGFIFASQQAGIARIGPYYIGWGTSFIDYDRDGAEDIFIANGHVMHHPPPGPNDTQLLTQNCVLLRNLYHPGMDPAKVQFEEVKAGPFFKEKYRARGVAFGDLDNDGRVDAVISCVNEPVVVLQNVLDNGNHWLGIELVGKKYRDAVAARLELQVGGRTLVRTVLGGGSYASASDRRVVFGLGQDQAVGQLKVYWPSGHIDTWDRLPTDRYWKLCEEVPTPQEPTGAKPVQEATR
jgi:hypothetical protein